jgi:flavodoxin
MKKALVIYYSQTGQAREIAEAVTLPLKAGFEVQFEELQPDPPFPFPWKGISFFQTFPESVQEIPCKLKPFSFDRDENYDLVILAFQTWYLSPSIPMNSFLQSPEAKRLLKNKPVVTIQGCRNMWAMAQERIKLRILEAGGRLVGNIVLVDRHPNLISVITIVRWMTTGKKERSRWFPAAGVPEKEIRDTSQFGEVILDAFQNDRLNELQDKLLEMGAVCIDPVLISIERRGIMMFRIWSRFILKKGVYGCEARTGRLKLFKYYLFAVIFLISPVVSLLFSIIHRVNPARAKRMICYYSGVG